MYCILSFPSLFAAREGYPRPTPKYKSFHQHTTFSTPRRSQDSELQNDTFSSLICRPGLSVRAGWSALARQVLIQGSLSPVIDCASRSSNFYAQPRTRRRRRVS